MACVAVHPGVDVLFLAEPTAEGQLIQSWGEPGTGPGQFHLPHDIWVTTDGRVLVADRENDRIQIFGLDGEFIDQWTHLQCPTGLCIDAQGLVYVSELWRRVGQPTFVYGVVEEDQPGRVSVLDLDGKVLARWGGRCDLWERNPSQKL